MATNRTFTMVKPDAVRAGNIGNILAMINNAGFRIVAMKYTHLTKESAGEFYAVHKERPFYGELVDFMSSGPIVAAILEKDNAIEAYRTLIGATNPAPASVRTQYTVQTQTRMQRKKVHSFSKIQRCTKHLLKRFFRTSLRFWSGVFLWVRFWEVHDLSPPFKGRAREGFRMLISHLKKWCRLNEEPKANVKLLATTLPHGGVELLFRKLVGAFFNGGEFR